jgi:general stress protein YciG
MAHGEEKEKKRPRGFAAMNAEKQRQIASKGGKVAHERGHAHEFTSEEAREAGRKGGMAVSRDRKHIAEIGRLGGEARSQSRSSSQQQSPPSTR